MTTQQVDAAPGISVFVPQEWTFESQFRTPLGIGFERHPYLGPMDSYERLLERWLQEATLENGRRWSKAGHEGQQVMLSLFTDDCPHQNPENDPKYDGVEFFQSRVYRARHPWRGWRLGAGTPDPYTVAFMEAAAAQHPLVAEFETEMREWEDHHGLTCDLSEMGTICRTCAEAHDEWDDDGMEPSGCRLHDDVVEAFGDFWFANGERS